MEVREDIRAAIITAIISPRMPDEKNIRGKIETIKAKLYLVKLKVITELVHKII